LKFRFKEKRISSVVEIDKAIDQFCNEIGLQRERIVESLKRIWKDIVGSILSAHSLPVNFYNGVLTVYVDHSVFANDIILMKEMIIKIIKEKGFKMAIVDIRVEVKRIRWERE
jgi:hypothetical protein